MAKTYDAAALRQAAYRKTWRKRPLRLSIRSLKMALHHNWRMVSHPLCRHEDLRVAGWMFDHADYYFITSRRCIRCDRLFAVDPPEKVIEPPATALAKRSITL